MNTNVKKVLDAFISNPYRVKMGAKTQARRLKVSIEDIKKARILFKQLNKNNKPKILILDIETSPMKAWVWNRWKENIYLDQTIQEWFMLSWSGKWLGEENTFGDVLTSKEVLEENDYRLLVSLHTILDKADIVIAHNGNKFDIPKINTRFILNGLTPPTPYKQIDTYNIVKKQFGFSTNSLDALATFFNIENKDPHDFQLWKACMEGDKEALSRLFKYNTKDILILEKIYLKLRPWVKNHPNINVITDSRIPCCTHCGSSNIEREVNSSYSTQAFKYSVYRCKDCGAIFRSKERLSNKQNFTSI